VPHKDINIKEFPGRQRGAKSDKTSAKMGKLAKQQKATTVYITAI